MRLRSSKTRTADETKRKALPVDTSLDQGKSNSATTSGSEAVNQEKQVHALIMVKGKNRENCVVKSEDETPHDNAAKGERSENTLPEHIAKGEDQALHQDPADREDAVAEYMAKGEEEDLNAQQALLDHAAIQQEENQELDHQRAHTDTFVYEATQGDRMDVDLEQDTVFIKEEEAEANQFKDVMDMDAFGETEEMNTSTNDAMDMEKKAVNGNAENDTALRAPMDNNVKTLIRQIAHECRLWNRAPEPASWDQSMVEDQEEDMEIAIKEETKKPDVTLELVSEYIYQCRKCPRQTRSFMALLDHFSADHKLNYKSRAIRKMHLEPNINDPNFYCRACERTFQVDRKYRDHLKNVHYIVLRPILDKNSDIIPDIDDPNNYCCSCKRKYTDKFLYRSHLRKFHKMEIAAIKVKTVKNPEIQPEWEDPHFYCRSCNYKYPSRYKYHEHCKTIHRMNLTTLTHPDVAPDPHHPDNYCIICNRSYKLRYYYREHLALFHGNTDFFRSKKRNKQSSASRDEIQPDINDPNFYCRVCDRKYARKWSYQCHLVSAHHIGKPFKKTSLEPEEDDPNYFCRACGRGYNSRDTYRNHLRKVHHMQLKSLKDIAKESGELPDPFDPNFYCRVCKVTKPSVKSYRNHCTYAHYMVLGPAPFINPDAEIDVNSLVFYCAKCDKHLANKQKFTKHLNEVHQMGIEDRFVYPDAEIDIDSPTLTCAKCGITFSDRYCYRRHLKHKHKLNLPSRLAS
ncbi:MAPK-activated protein kinase Srk1 [Mucor velutinosus]|uniref:MAPK-activated protein kinase Srk1 n=1 Tax=Mucor velutinosus TaxID=708070 RepID=A0AAN7DPP5_9FUNG|nr:MAPK-activated protein kinase Srk1 [Mucor velutinosus]